MIQFQFVLHVPRLVCCRRLLTLLEQGLRLTQQSEFESLVYKVYPLPDSLRQYVWNFDDPSNDQEGAYLDTQLKQLQYLDANALKVTTELLRRAHRYCRNAGDDAAVSLRDIKRFSKLASFWATILAIPEVSVVSF
jgi:hypothetical protein